MKYGLFMMPSHPPERNIYDAHQWDLDYLTLCDSLGYDEAWIGEHFTSPWEPIPAPDIMIAQALMRTKRMKLGTGVHLLPYHHPAELAHRIAYPPSLRPCSGRRSELQVLAETARFERARELNAP